MPELKRVTAKGKMTAVLPGPGPRCCTPRQDRLGEMSSLLSTDLPQSKCAVSAASGHVIDQTQSTVAMFSMLLTCSHLHRLPLHSALKPGRVTVSGCGPICKSIPQRGCQQEGFQQGFWAMTSGSILLTRV